MLKESNNFTDFKEFKKSNNFTTLNNSKLTLNSSKKKKKKFTDFKQHSQSGHLSLPTPHCAAPVLLTGCHATLEVSDTSHPPLPRVLWIWESVFHSQTFFTLHSFLLFSRLPWGRQFNLKVSRASCWPSKHSPSSTICLNHSNPQKRYIGRFYLSARAGQPQNIKLHGEVKYLLLTGFELFSW